MQLHFARVTLRTIKAIERAQAQLQHAAREAREIIRGQKQQLAQNEQLIERAREAPDDVRS